MAYPPHRSSLSPPSFPSRPNKIIMQRQYREKEGECFNTLRDVIKGLTGEELQTRQEILRKAIDLLLGVSKIRAQRAAETVPPALYEMFPPISSENTTVAQGHLGYPAQQPHHPQTWVTDAELHAPSAYHTAPFHGQQDDFMFDMDAALVQASYLGSGKDWSGHAQY